MFVHTSLDGSNRAHHWPTSFHTWFGILNSGCLEVTNEGGIWGPRQDASREIAHIYNARVVREADLSALCSGNQALQLQGFSATEHSKCDGTKVRYGERDPGLWSLANERVGYRRSCHNAIQWNWIMHDYLIQTFFCHSIIFISYLTADTSKLTPL